MLFNSFAFLAFLPAVFLLHWAVRNTTWRNGILLAASYVFYGFWDVRFLGLIVLSTGVDFLAGLMMEGGKKKLGLWMSLGVNLGVLITFKYAGFFVSSWVDAWQAVGIAMSMPVWNLVLPVGISFYTFQTLSYTLDVYRGSISAERNPLTFAAFVAFFPQLVAGPIERASSLLPQFHKLRTFNYDEARAGMRLMLWGLFKKVLVADTCAAWVDALFSDPMHHTGPMLALGAVLFGFQIYGDFSGYSDIAVGTARLFGVRLHPNFNFPYFARNIGAFWRRWHMTLTAWFRDYVYIPLGGSREGGLRTFRNTAVVFLLSGLWHGANWTFIAWGGVHAIMFVPVLVRRNRAASQREPQWLRRGANWALTFVGVTGAWVLFRAESVGAAWQYYLRLFAGPAWHNWESVRADWLATESWVPFPLKQATGAVLLLVLAEALAHSIQAKSRFLQPAAAPLRWLCYALVLSQIYFRLGAPQGFIYFQF